MNLFQRNITLLRSKWPAMANLLETATGGVLTVQMARCGVPTATVNGRFIHSAYYPEREGEQWAIQYAPNCQPGEEILIKGVGLLYHAEALRRILSGDHSVTVLVSDLNELKDCLSVRSIAGWGDRLEWACGSPSEVVGTIISKGKSFRILNYGPAACLHEEWHQEVHALLREDLAKRTQGRLHIMVVGPIYGGSLPIAGYAVNALKALGHRVSWIDHSLYAPGYRHLDCLRDVRLRLTVQQKFSETLGIISLAHVAEDPPDLVLAMAQAPLSMAVLEQLRRKKIITAMWFVENFRHLTYWQQMATGYDFWFVMQKEECHSALVRAGAAHVSYLPLAADPSVHKPLMLSSQEEQEYGADVSFLGAGYLNRRHLFPGLLGQEWTFKLWGNEWDEAGPLSAVLQRGGTRIDSETSVKIFNATKINLNVHSFAGEGLDPQGDSINPRTFELACCGAFQLIDSRSLLSELFDETSLGVFHKPEDLIPTVRRYYGEPEERVSMAQQSRRRVLQAHTYEHRMHTLLSEVGVERPDRLGAILQGARQVQTLVSSSADCPELMPLLQQFPLPKRVELEDLAQAIRRKGPEAKLNRGELLLLMMDEYRQEKRDFV